jgi:class 3 adenylate cyclase/tetratricopeptide (TPR) repeat protein
MRCSKCGTDNREGRKFCAECGEALASKCPRCGASNESREKFCGECGAALKRSESAAASKSNDPQIRIAETSPPENLEGGRKTVTALFADIKGSTELEQNLDPEEARAIIDPALKIMIDAARHYDGYVQSAGDGIFALFGAPIAHEDHPQRALHAALRMQREIRRYGDRLLEAGRVPIEIRVGVNTGEVVMRPLKTSDSHIEYAPIGHTTNLASRMQAVARTGSVVVSEATRKLVEGYFQLKAIGPTRVKGVNEPVHVYEVTGLGPLRTRLQRSASRGYTKFVGRHAEMEALKHAAERAQTGRGQIVAAMADPGVGKSRLFLEFKATSQSRWLVLDALALSHEKATAYAPLIDLLRVYFHITPDDDARTRREKVAGRIAMLDPGLEDTRPYVFALLGIVEGIDPLAGINEQIRRRRTQEAVKRVLLRESLNQPVMLIFEDLHWIDGETQGFLNLLAEGVANASLLLLVNYRPEYTHRWNSKTYYTQLRLDPLGTESAAEMLTSRIGDSPDLASLKRLVLERTQGNPLFIEELVEALFEEGVLVRNGAVKVTRTLNQLKIPPTVQGILAARIDRLAPEAKELLQTLAVIGSEFPLALVRQVVQLPDDRLVRLLDVLQAAEFIYEQPATGDVEYSFKHALTKEEAYKSLLTERRKLLHERTARAMEAVYTQRLEDLYAELAYHYGSSDNAAKAIEYLRLAGEQAVDRGAYAQSGADAELALKLIELLPEGEERLRAELGVRRLEGMVAAVLYGLSSAERLQAAERVCALSERLRDPHALLPGLLNMAAVHSARGEVSRAEVIAKRCLELAERNLNGKLPPILQYTLATNAINSGDLLQASSIFRELMPSVESAHQGDAASSTPMNLWVFTPLLYARVQLSLGRADEALKLVNEALRRARELKHAFNLSGAYAHAATLRRLRREPEAARELAEAAIALAEESGFGIWRAFGGMERGWALAESGQVEKGIEELEANAPVPHRSSFLVPQRSFLLAQFYIRLGRADRALKLLDETLAGVEVTGKDYRAGLHKLKGEAILMRDSSATAESEKCFRKAIEIARGQSARWWELRATVSLARLLRDTNRREEARAMLSEIYNWFTEGFDTADLKDAKALLDELSGSP